MKKCTGCGVEKEVTSFARRKDRKEGYRTRCNDCINEKRRERFENLEKYKQKREREKKYYNSHREKLNEAQKKYYENLTEEKKQKLAEKKRIYFRNSQEQKKKKYEYLRNIYDKKKIYANIQIYEALQSGKIIKPSRCQICGKEKTLDGHHHDYDKPLDVIWVCRKCHMKIHKSYEENLSIA